jgi:hypothetical protein
MSRHRFRAAAAPAPAPDPGAFVLWPSACLPPVSPEQGLWQQALYHWAFTEAQAVVQPSLPERDLLAVWN